MHIDQPRNFCLQVVHPDFIHPLQLQLFCCQSHLCYAISDCKRVMHMQIKMARPQVNAQQQTPGQFGGGGAYGARGGFTGRGSRGGRGYNQAYGYNQYGGGYDAAGGYSAAGAGYGYDANGGYGYAGYGQYPAGMQMVPMMLQGGQVGSNTTALHAHHWNCHRDLNWAFDMTVCGH